MYSTSFAGGATSKSVYVRAETISTGLPYTAGAYNTATISAQYVRNQAAAVSITLATLASASASWSSGGFIHVGKGKYRLDVPNAAIVAGADSVTFAIDGIADVAWSEAKIEIVGSDPRAAFTADVNVTSMAANVLTASAIASDAVTEIQSGLATASALNTVDDFLDTEIASIISSLTTIAGYLDTEVAAIKAKTDNLPASPAATSDIPSANTIRDAVFSRAFHAKMGAYTFEELTAFIACALLGKATGLASSPVFRNLADNANAIAATTDGIGNRSAVTLSASNVR